MQNGNGSSPLECDIFQKCFDFEDAKFVKASGLYPFFKAVEKSKGSTVYFGSRPVVMISSNNYLGLTHDPYVQKKAAKAIRHFGTGCTGSRFLNGNTVLHNELEEKLAHFVGKEEVLVFTTGFLTNLGTIGCLAGENDLLFSDTENHASIIEGCRLSKAKVITYRHNDISDLRKKLREAPQDPGKMVVTDGVFSMTGDILNLPDLVALKKEFPRLRIFVDDAHGLGVMGPTGSGICRHFGLEKEVDLIMGTFSKSFASIGGFLAGNPDVIDYVRHKARSFMFSAAMPPSAVATVLACLEKLQRDPGRIEKLKENCRFILKGFEKLGLSYLPSQTPIISIFVGDEGKAFHLVQELFEEGVFTTPVCYPAVPFGQALLRTSYMATHTKRDLKKVLSVFAKLAPKYGILKEQVTIPKELTHQSGSYNFEALAGTALASGASS